VRAGLRFDVKLEEVALPEFQRNGDTADTGSQVIKSLLANGLTIASMRWLGSFAQRYVKRHELAQSFQANFEGLSGYGQGRFGSLAGLTLGLPDQHTLGHLPNSMSLPCRHETNNDAAGEFVSQFFGALGIQF
jgi:hypothetical protein